MTAQTILRLVTYGTAGSILILGILLLGGFFLAASIPANFRIITGVMMILYGIIRIVMITMRSRRGDETNE